MNQWGFPNLLSESIDNWFEEEHRSWSQVSFVVVDKKKTSVEAFRSQAEAIKGEDAAKYFKEIVFHFKDSTKTIIQFWHII